MNNNAATSAHKNALFGTIIGEGAFFVSAFQDGENLKPSFHNFSV
jgi:hypothetical protein